MEAESMTAQEYRMIQQDLDRLIEKYKQQHLCCPKYAETAKEAILRCKSAISRYNPAQGGK